MEWYKTKSNEWNYVYGLIWRLTRVIIIAGGLLFSTFGKPLPVSENPQK